MLLGGLSEDYRALYENAINTAKEHNLFRLVNPQNLNPSGWWNCISWTKKRSEDDSAGQSCAVT